MWFSSTLELEKLVSKHRKKYDKTKSNQIDVEGKWVGVRKGQVLAPDTYVDSKGVLRSSGDDSCVVWHLAAKVLIANGSVPCAKRGIQPHEIVYHPESGAPWCPECWPLSAKLQAEEKSKVAAKVIASMFETGNFN